MQLKLDNSISYALALEGGGAKGAYQIGAWRAFEEAGIRIDAVSGTSVGALNGALIAMGDLDRAEEIWKNIRFSQVMDVDDDTMEKLLHGELRELSFGALLGEAGELIRGGGFDVTPLRNWIRETVSEDAVRASARELYIVTYSLSDQRELELRAKDLEDGALWDMLLASAYLPVFRTEKLGGKRYADGGVRDVLPLHVLVENGYRHILAPRLYGVGVERPLRIPRGTKIYPIEPTDELGGTLEFTAEQSRRNLRLGYYDTMRFLYGLRGRTLYIDAQWDERRGCDYLMDTIAACGVDVSLRTMYEKILPALARRLDVPRGGYDEIALALWERAAEQAETERFAVYTEEELLNALAGAEGELLGELLRDVPAAHRKERALPEPPRPALPEKKDEGLHICLLNDSFPPTVDGVANAVCNYARILSAKEASCVVATPEYPGVTDDYPFPVVRYPSLDTMHIAGYRAGMPFAPQTVAALAAQSVDIIHTHCPFSSTLLARSLRESTNAPIIFTYHTKFDIDIARAVRGEKLKETAVRLLVNNIAACDEVWVVSEGAGQNLRSLGYTGDYVVMPNGVDLPRGRALPREIEELSLTWGLPDGVPVYLFVGRLMWYKGLRLLLDGLRRAADAGRDFRMVFVGDGQDRAEVEAYAEEIGLAPRCRFVGMEKEREVIRAWYSRADLLLFPSTFDTNGLVVREAAACSLASVLIRGSCAAEGIEDGKTGLLIDETAESLGDMLCSPACERAALRALGERSAKDLYISWEESVERARERYRVVLSRWRSGELRRKKAPLDGLFDRGGEMAERLELAREQRQEAASQLRDELERAREWLERYL